eukprot:gnl/MRDRNA2_/MRDRNA2_56270_c0_seq1.p1 gnl/MRDRNA2_/MRDRNA2_56270_c0~~gnl/MRDRNA2_/MRDRNA2_56270_c0_seq1.p1  ORF type:complete len:612 (+),score=142.70 gnl/MRDRNA2_/MRDRNA2_56270_c0_seq1:62-1897(+)
MSGKASEPSGDCKNQILETFRQFDANKDGKLDRQELLSIFKQLIMPGQDPAIHERECELIIEAADKNGDGVISVEEFLSWVYSSEEARPDTANADLGGHERIHLNYKTLLPEQYEIDISTRYEMDKMQIGEGGYGKVFVARDTGCENRKVVVKRVTKTGNQRTNSRFYSEIKIMKELDHPNICRLLGTFEEGNTIYFIMEYLQGGELFDKILDMEVLSEQFTADVLEQVVAALRYAHGRSIAHRDLKPENIVFASKDPENSHCKVIDWGMGMSFADCRMCDIVGSTLYMAPEVYEATTFTAYTEACDMWSLGVLAYVMLSGKQPFWGSNDQMQQRARAEKYPFQGLPWISLSKDATDFIKSLLKADPKQRANIEQVSACQWFKSVKENSAAMDPSLGVQMLHNLRQFRGANSFTALCIAAVAKQLDHAELQDIHMVFKGMDKNGDGVLTLEEIASGFGTMLGKDSPTYREIVETFKSLDLDGSNSIDYTEFCSGGLGQMAIVKDEACWGAFKTFDKDNTGALCNNELQSVLESADLKATWGPDVCKDVAQKVLEKYDKDGDGMMNFEEFKSMMQSTWQAAGKKEDSKAGRRRSIAPQDLFRMAEQLRSESS